jgi:cytosine permease
VSTSNQLPDYIISATPNPASNRAPWHKNTAPAYAGIFLWFVFWQDAAKAGPPGGTLAQGLGWALLSLAVAAMICHALFYLVPGLFGMRTGLPLYIVGTSTFGATGGFLMPGFLMGVLQFGWVGVNVYFSSLALSAVIPVDAKIIMVVWGALAAFVGLKGIQYVAKVATYLPLIPLVVLLWLVSKTAGDVGQFDAATMIAAERTASATTAAPLGHLGVLAAMLTYVVGFFATAGAAGVDFGTNSRDSKDVQMGGLIGIALAILLTAGFSLVIVAGVAGGAKGVVTSLSSFDLIPAILGKDTAKWVMFLLAIAAFPPACFSSFIAANSFKTTLPKVNPFISVGIGTAISVVLAVTGLVAKAVAVFVIIGASFGPICGAMLVDYLLSKGEWTGPRAGFNPAGWIAWALGFVVGILPNLHAWNPSIPDVPAAPVMAFVVGAVVYFLCAKLGLQSAVVPLPKKS